MAIRKNGVRNFIEEFLTPFFPKPEWQSTVMKKTIHSIKELARFAQKIARSTKPGDVIGLVGELGAGKTTFVQCLAKALGVTARVNSPTFLVMRVYGAVSDKLSAIEQKNLRLKAYSLKLVHIDAYRLKSGQDLEAMGALEYIGAPDTITVIEWADRVKKILPKKTRWIEFEHGKKPTERIIKYRHAELDSAS